MSADMATGDLALRVERGADGSLTARLHDKWGWTWTASLSVVEVDGRKGWSAIARLSDTPEQFKRGSGA